MKVKKGGNLILILLITVFIFVINFASASLGALVKINPTGTSYGHELLWKANVTGDFDEQGIAIYANDTVFVNSVTHGKISALNATTGELIWNVSTGTSWDGFGGPYFYNGIIYSAIGKIYSLNATTGELIWNTPTRAFNFNQNVALNEKYLAAVSYQGHVVYVFNRTTGDYVWHASQGTSIFSEPLLYGDYLLVACFGGTTSDLTAYNMSNNGSIIWTADTDNYHDSFPIISGNIVYIAEDEKLNAIYLNNGSLIWSRTITTSTTSSAPSIHNNVVFVGTQDTTSKLVAYYINGTSKWNFTKEAFFVLESVYNQPAISGGLVFFNTQSGDDGVMYALNETDGSLIWDYPILEDIYGFTSIAQGNAYVVTDDQLYAFDFGVGSGDWTLIGHDTNRTGYCSDCITEWQNIKLNCTVGGNLTCTVNNSYNHAVFANISDKAVKYNWYNSSGNLVESNSNNYFVELDAGEVQTLTLEGAGEVIDCGDLTVPGVYRLTNDLYAGSFASCINITSSNITLDCQDHTISGNEWGVTDAYGIYASGGKTNITLANCNVSDFDTANIYFQNINNSNLVNITSVFGAIDGIYLDLSYFNNLTNITSYSNVAAQLLLYRSSYNSLNKINVSGSTRTSNSLAGGLIFYTASYNNVTSLTSFSNALRGLYFYSTARNNIILNATIYSNNDSGIKLESSARNNLIANSTIRNSTGYGVYMISSFTNSFYNNFFNNSINFYSASNSSSYANTLNTTKKLGLNIQNQSNPYIGGNFWAAPNGAGFSETCTDTLRDGFCDNVIFTDTGSSWINDSLPLSDEYALIVAPTISLVSPSNNSGDSDGNLTFSYIVSAPLPVMNCSLIFQNGLNQTNTSITRDITQNFSINGLDVGKYSWKINCTDYVSNRSTTDIRYFTVVKSNYFSGNTTDLSQVENISNIQNLVIENPSYGKINFSESIDLESGADLNILINISSNKIEVNSSASSELNKSARLSLYSLTYNNPRVLKDGVLCSDCTEVSYSGGTFVFDVNSFSVYSAEETPHNDSETDGSSENVETGSPTYNLENKKYDLSLKKGLTLVFYLHNKFYSLNVIGVNETLKFNISNQIIDMGVNETKKLNLAGENYYDFEIYLKNIKNSVAYISVSKIYEEIPEEIPVLSNETAEQSDFFVDIGEFVPDTLIMSDDEILILVLVVLLLLFILWKIAKRKSRHSKK